MSEETELLEAVVANPENRLARHNYLTWLRSAGVPEKSARASILEAQYSLASTPVAARGDFSLPATALASVRQFAEQWFGPGLDFLEDWWTLDEGINVSARQYLMMDEARLSFAPVSAIYLCTEGYFGREESEEEDDYARLAARPSLAYWLSLILEEKGVPNNCFAPLIRSPHLKHLNRLYIFDDCGLGEESVEAIAYAPNLSGLRHLNLNSLGEARAPTDASLDALAKSPFLGRLLSLLLLGDFSTAGVSALATSPNVALVRSLRLHGRLTGESVRALAASPYLTELTDLGLGVFNEAMEGIGVEALLAWGQLSKITNLGLGGTGLTDDGVIALARSPRVAALEKLDLGHNHMVTRAGVEALLASPSLNGLKELNLWAVQPLGQGLREKILARFGDRATLPLETPAA